MNDINVELGYTGTQTITLNDAAVRALAGIPSGAISLSDFYGKSSETYYVSAYGLKAAYFPIRNMEIDSSNNLYTFGTIAASLSYVSKFTSAGAITWSKRVQSNVSVLNGTVDSSGNVYAVGYSGTPAVNSNTDAVLIKFDSSGNQVWTRTMWDLGKCMMFTSCAVNSSGDVYVHGIYCFNQYADWDKIIVAKYDSSGNLVWKNDIGTRDVSVYTIGYEGIEDRKSSDCKIDSSGNVYVCGHCTAYYSAPTFSTNSVYMMKFDSSGTRQWAKLLDSSNTHTRGTSMVLDQAAGYAYTAALSVETTRPLKLFRVDLSTGAGQTILSMYDSTDFTVGQMIPTGNTLSRFAGGSPKITRDSSGFLYITLQRRGFFNDFGEFDSTWGSGSASGPAICVIKVNPSNTSSGFPVWTRITGQNNQDLGGGVHYFTRLANSGHTPRITSGGRLVIGINGVPADNNYHDGLICKVPTDGSQTGNYGGYFTWDTAVSPQYGGIVNGVVNYDHTTGTSLFVNNSTPTLTISAHSASRTTTTFTTRSYITASGPEKSVRYFGDYKYYRTDGANGTKYINISAVPSGKVYRWTAVGATAGSGVSGAGGDENGSGTGGDGAAGGQVKTGTSAAIGTLTLSNASVVLVGGTTHTAASYYSGGGTGANGDGVAGGDGALGSDGLGHYYSYSSIEVEGKPNTTYGGGGGGGGSGSATNGGSGGAGGSPNGGAGGNWMGGGAGGGSSTAFGQGSGGGGGGGQVLTGEPGTDGGLGALAGTYADVASSFVSFTYTT